MRGYRSHLEILKPVRDEHHAKRNCSGYMYLRVSQRAVYAFVSDPYQHSELISLQLAEQVTLLDLGIPHEHSLV